MKSSKERKMDRKRKHKALAVSKTEKSRQRRLDNKTKRAEIHAIDPDMKVKVINQVIYDDLDTEIMVENGKIKTVETFKPEPEKYNKDWTIDDQIEKERLGVSNPFRWKKKLTL